MTLTKTVRQWMITLGCDCPQSLQALPSAIEVKDKRTAFEEEVIDQIDLSIFYGNLRHDDHDKTRNCWTLSDGSNFRVRSKHFCYDKSKIGLKILKEWTMLPDAVVVQHRWEMGAVKLHDQTTEVNSSAGYSKQEIFEFKEQLNKSYEKQ